MVGSFFNSKAKALKSFFEKRYYDLRLAKEYLYDFNTFRRFYSRVGQHSTEQTQTEARIIVHYHVLEKGLSHHAPKKKFGFDAATRTLSLLEDYLGSNFPVTQQIFVAAEVLGKYSNSEYIAPWLDESFVNRVNQVKKNVAKRFEKIPTSSGMIALSREDFFQSKDKPFNEFALSRYSCRNFTDDEVSLETIEDAVLIAQKSPSVCNRQTSRVHCITEKKEIQAHLMYQQGNRGFGDKINKLLIITSDLRLFVNIKEKNQAFVDGGIFSMSLLYALHNQALGAVPLNWSYDSTQDSSIRKLGTIPEHEKIILMIGVGNVPESVSIPASQRRPLSEVLVIHS